jgi:hypothetical protein
LGYFIYFAFDSIDNDYRGKIIRYNITIKLFLFLVPFFNESIKKNLRIFVLKIIVSICTVSFLLVRLLIVYNSVVGWPSAALPTTPSAAPVAELAANGPTNATSPATTAFPVSLARCRASAALSAGPLNWWELTGGPKRCCSWPWGWRRRRLFR